MDARDWWLEFQAALEWADAERRMPNGLVGPLFTVHLDGMTKALGPHSAHRAVNQGQRIATGIYAIRAGREPATALRTGMPSRSL